MPIFKFPDRYFSFCSYNGTDRCFKLNIRLEIFGFVKFSVEILDKNKKGTPNQLLKGGTHVLFTSKDQYNT